MFKRILGLVLPLIFLAAGIFVIVLGIKQLNMKKEYDETGTAIITGIEREWTGTDDDGFDEYSYTVLIDYEIDGKKYEDVVFPYYNSSMKKGDTVEFLYKTDDPSNIVPANTGTTAVIMMVFGSVFALLGVFGEVRALLGKATA